MVDIKQSLRNFVATSNSGKYATEDEVFAKFPEFDGYDRQLLRNFVATSNSGKYATEEEVFAKFPEFNIDVKKKDQSQTGYGQTQPGNGSSNSQDELLRRAKEMGWNTVEEYRRANWKKNRGFADFNRFQEEQGFGIEKQPEPQIEKIPVKAKERWEDETISATKRLEEWYKANPTPRYPTESDLAPEELRKAAELEQTGSVLYDTSKLSPSEKKKYETVQQAKQDIEKRVTATEIAGRGNVDFFLDYYDKNKDKLSEFNYDDALKTLSDFKKDLQKKYGPNFQVTDLSPEDAEMYDQLSNAVISVEDQITQDYLNSLKSTGTNKEEVEKYEEIMNRRASDSDLRYEVFADANGVLRRRPVGTDQYVRMGGKFGLKKDFDFAEEDRFLREFENKAIKTRTDAKLMKLGKMKLDKPWGNFFNDLEPKYTQIGTVNDNFNQLFADLNEGKISQEDAKVKYDELKGQLDSLNKDISTTREAYNISEKELNDYYNLMNTYGEESALKESATRKRTYLEELDYATKLAAEKRYDELSKGFTNSSLLIAAGDMAGTYINQLAIESMKALKPLGETFNLGLDSYGWSDKLYDTASALSKANHNVTGYEKPSDSMASDYSKDRPEFFGAEGTPLPTSTALMMNLSNGLGSAFAFMTPAGVASKLIKGAGYGSMISRQILSKGGMFLQLEAQNYERNLKAGMSADDAAELSILQSLQDVAAESFFNEAAMLGKIRPAGFISALRSGVSKREAFKAGMNWLVDTGKSVAKSATMESIEEGLGQLSQDVGAKEAELLYNNKNYEDIFQAKAYANSMVAGALTGGFLDGVRALKPMSPSTIEALNYAGTNAREILQQVAILQNEGKIDQKKYRQIEESLNRLSEITQSSTDTPGFSELSQSDKNAFVATLFQLDQLNSNTKQLGIETEKAKKMKSILQQRATNILEGKRTTDEGNPLFRTYMDRNLQDMGVAVVDVQDDGSFNLYVAPGLNEQDRKEVVSKATAYLNDKIKNDAIVAAKFQPKIKTDAVQESSTEEVLPRQQGETTETGGQPQGMGPSVQGQEATQEGETEEQRQERIAKEASAGAAEVVTELNAPNALAASVFPVVGEVEAQIEKGEFVSDEKSTEAQDKLYELLGDIDAREDLTPEQKQRMSAVIENRIQKIQDYDYRTRTETSTTTQTVAAGTTPKAQKQNERAAIPVRTVAEEGIDVTYDGRQGRVELRDGQYVFVPKKLGAVQARPVVIGEAAQVNAGSKFAGVENPTTGPNNSVANITLPNGSTLSVLNDDLSIDIGLEIAKQEVGAAPQALFDTVFEEVVTENKVEVPYLRETKPAQEQAATTEQISEQTTEQISEQKPTNIPPSTQQATTTEEKPAYTGNTTQDRALKDKYKADNLKRRILDQAQRIASALGKNTQVYVHETTEEYNKAIAERLGEDQKESTNGRFLYGDGVSEIHIDLSKANEKTLPHEAVHAVLYKAFGENEKLFQQFKDKLKPLLANSTVAELENFANQETYVRQGVTAEEFLAELGGVMTAAGNRIPKTTLQKITQLLNEFLSKITGGRIAPLSTGEVIDLFNSMAEAFASGKSIQSLMDSKGLIGSGKINGNVKSKQSINTKLPEQQERTSNFSKVKEIKLADLNDKTGVLTGSDRLTTAVLKFSDGSTMTLKGGIFYPSETGLVWASTDITGAKALADKINQVIQEQGEAWLFPVNNAYGSQKSNYTFFEVAMNHLKVAVKQRGVKKDQLIEKLNKFKKTKKYENAFKVGYKPKVFTQSLSNKNLEEIYSMLHEDFLPENATYPGRLSFIESFFGGPNTKSRPFDTVPNTAELIEMTTEPVNGDSRAFTTSSAIKITGKVNPRETTNDGDGELFHSSYPAVIESEGSVESYVLDGTYPIEEVFPEFKKANGETVNWEDVKKEEIEKGNEPSFENYKNKIISAQGSIPRIAKVKSKSQVSDQEFESLPGSDLTQLDFRELSIPKLKSKSQISNKKKEEFKKMLEKKRPDLKERGLIDSVIEDVEKFGEENSQGGKGNPKLEKLALHWIYNANLILPEDGYKVVDAEKVATKNNVDPFGYSSPESLMDAFRDTIKEKPIDPDTIPTFTNKKEIPGTDIVVYDVDDTKEGQADVRRIADTHWGKSWNNWCLVARLDGSLDKAWELWSNRYNAIDKKIAFKNGKLLCFRASDYSSDNTWWDKMDESTEGIPTIEDIGDGKKQNVVLSENGKVVNRGDIFKKTKDKYEKFDSQGNLILEENFKNNKKDGVSKEYYNSGNLRIYENYKDGKKDGIQKYYLPDGTLERELNYDNGFLNTAISYWNDGVLRSQYNYKDNKLNGIQLVFDRQGNKKSEEYYINDVLNGVSKHYHVGGKTLYTESNYKNGRLDGISREWNVSGILIDESNYKFGQLEGLKKTSYFNGRLKSIETFKDGRRDGIAKNYNPDGSISDELNYKNGKKYGVQKSYYNDGSYTETYINEDGTIKYSKEILPDKESSSNIKSKSQTTTVYNASPKEVNELGKRSGVAYFATNKREADEYARMNRGEVREFNIPNSDIQPEEVIIDKINELGLKPKDSSFSVDESSLFELIDDRFENSLSKEDIDKLFKALKEDGIKAFEYTDETQVVGGLTTSIAVIDNKYIQELSTGLKSKSQAIPKATTESKDMMSEFEMAANKTGLAKENSVRRFVEKYGEKGLVAKEINDNFEKIQEQLGITKICNI